MGYSEQRASRSVNLEHTPGQASAPTAHLISVDRSRIVSGQADRIIGPERTRLRGFLLASGGFSVMRAVRLSALSLLFPAVVAAFAFAQPQQNVPDAPAPQAQSAPPNAPAPQSQQPLPDLKGQVPPGKGASPGQDGAAAAGQPAPQTSSGTVGDQQQAPPPPDAIQPTPPETGPAIKQPYTIPVNVTAVEVPITVRDKHGALVPGLPWWRFRVYEDGIRQNIHWFSDDAYPLSIAFVIDATLPSEDIMDKVNQSLPVVSNGLTPADTVAVVTYGGTGPQLIVPISPQPMAPRLTAALRDREESPASKWAFPSPKVPSPAAPSSTASRPIPPFPHSAAMPAAS
jgi:hypothetical protein